MGFTGSIIVIALGAILRYAVNDSIQGVNLATIGLILMIAGAAALLISIGYALMWSSDRREAYRTRRGGYAAPDEPVR